jgi:hemolysin III
VQYIFQFSATASGRCSRRRRRAPTCRSCAEIIADGVVHAIGVCLGVIGAITIVVMAVKIERIDVAPILVYVIGLVTMLAFSAAYNMWPVSPVKWVLRRFDHSAIYSLGSADADRSTCLNRRPPIARRMRCRSKASMAFTDFHFPGTTCDQK